jgi:hypothetical protein
MDMVGHDIAIISEWFVTEGAFATLGGNLPVEELPHFSVRAEFPVSPGMMRVFDAPNSHLALASFSPDCLSAAAGERTVKWAALIPAESHDVLLIGLGAMVGLGWAGNEIARFSDWKPLRSLFSQRLDTEPGGGVASEHLADADVLGEHLGRFVPCLAHDVALADSVHRGLGADGHPRRDL